MAVPSVGEQIVSLLNEAEDQVDKLEGLLAQGFDIDSVVDNYNTTSLHRASKKGHVESVKLLLSKGASPTLLDGFNSTPLHIAADSSHSNVLDVLTKAVLASDGPAGLKKLINLVDWSGNTAFLLAVQNCDCSVVELLLPHADLNIRDGQGWAAGHKAVYRAATSDEFEVMKLVLEAYPNEMSKFAIAPEKDEDFKDGKSVLHIASTHNSGDVVEWLLERMDKDIICAKDDWEVTAWEAVCAIGWPSNDRSFDAMSAFVLHESLHGSMSRACNGDFSCWSDSTRPDEHYDCYFYEMNNIPSVLVALRKLKKAGAITQGGFTSILEELYDHREIFDPEHVEVVLRYREPSCRLDNVEVSKHIPSGLPSDKKGYVALVIPYFHLVPFKSVSFWRKYHDSPLAYDDYITVSWEFCRSERPQNFDIFPSLTLDEYSSPILPWNVLKKRNMEQVIQRVDREQPSTTGHDRKDRATMVGQLWLWYINGTFIASPLAREENSPFELPDLFGTEVSKGVTGSNYLRRVGIILHNIVKTVNHPKFPIAASRDSILDGFEKAITIVSEKVTVYIEDTSVESISTEAEKSFLHDISDIQEELSMVRRVILQQEEIWKDFAYNAWPQYWANGQEGRMIIPRQDWQSGTISEDEAKEWKIILQTQTLFDKYYRRLEHLKEDAERVERSVLTQLDLKQKHATLKESHATAVMSAAVLGFTIITIIFTPLSFVTSLFALPIDQFQRNQHDSPYDDETRMYTAGYIGRWATVTGVSSTAVAIAAMWLMIDLGMGVPLTRYSWEFCKSLPRRIWALIRHRKWKVEATNQTFDQAQQHDVIEPKVPPEWLEPHPDGGLYTLQARPPKKPTSRLGKLFCQRHRPRRDVENNATLPVITENEKQC